MCLAWVVMNIWAMYGEPLKSILIAREEKRPANFDQEYDPHRFKLAASWQIKSVSALKYAQKLFRLQMGCVLSARDLILIPSLSLLLMSS